MGKKLETIEDVIADMRRLQSKLPSRPGPEEVAISLQTLARIDGSLVSRLEEIFQQPRPPGVPLHVFRAYQEMREDLLRAQAQTEKRMAMATMEIEERHKRFESLIEKVQSAASHPLNNSAVVNGSAYDYKDNGNQTADGLKCNSLPSVSEDGIVPDLGPLGLNEKSLSRGLVRSLSWKSSSELTKTDAASNTGRTAPPPEAAFKSRPAEPEVSPSDSQEGVRVYSPELLEILDRAAARKVETLKLSNMELTWLPETIGLLTNLTSLDISGNRLQAVPESIGELERLTHLDCQANQLKSLPETLGCLTNLRHLDIQKNSIEELPWTIGLCTELVEFHADFNQLKALPEAMGHLTLLQKMTVHLNSLKSLPTTISSLTNLVELDVHFNHLESVPESLCYLPYLTKLDISSNFTELRELPKSIGQLQSLRELNISYNHISVLPNSFGMLTGLEKLEMDGNPWIIPPMEVTMQGKEAVIEFMNNMVQQLKQNDKARPKKSGVASLMSVFKKHKNAKFKVKVDNYLDFKA